MEADLAERLAQANSSQDLNTAATVEESILDETNTEDSPENAPLTAEQLAQQPLPEAEQVMDERINYLINSMLRDVINRGTGAQAKELKRSDLAGKTGTTNGPTDAWFSGYNSALVATTWLGFDQNQNLGTREFGGSAALPIWIDFMREALQGVPEQLPRQPDGIVSVKINPDTGERALPGDPDGIFEVFREEMAPKALEGNQGTSKVADSIEELF